MKKSDDDKPWTRKELSLRVGFSELAAAVIAQWHRDGKPACDKKSIEYWLELKQMCDELEKK